MPNWCECSLTVKINKYNYEKFIELFSKWNDQVWNESREYRFYRSFLDYEDVIDQEDDDTFILDIDFSCAWSFYGCFIDKQVKECLDIFQAIKKFDIKQFTLRSSEPGCAFEEEFEYDNNEDMAVYKCFDIPLYKSKFDDYDEFNDIDEIPTVNSSTFELTPKIEVVRERNLQEMLEFYNIKNGEFIKETTSAKEDNDNESILQD